MIRLSIDGSNEIPIHVTVDDPLVYMEIGGVTVDLSMDEWRHIVRFIDSFGICDEAEEEQP